MNQIGPESPRYIPIPEPPQSSFNRPPTIKGSLPVPRNVFAKNAHGRRPFDKLDETTRKPAQEKAVAEGSREEWKHKMSEMRRRNLREGLSALQERQVRTNKLLSRRSLERQRERETLLAKPELESERLTTPSTNMDVPSLLHGGLSDPTRNARLEARRKRYNEVQETKRAQREEATHSLFMEARTFCTTPAQLDAEVEEAFGTDADPVIFGKLTVSPYRLNTANHVSPSGEPNQLANRGAMSVWAYGKPERVQDMLNRANRQGARGALASSSGYSSINKERVRRIAETLTGGKMENDERR